MDFLLSEKTPITQDQVELLKRKMSQDEAEFLDHHVALGSVFFIRKTGAFIVENVPVVGE